MKVTVQYSLCDNSLNIRYTSNVDKDTLCSLTNHSYFNLSGHNSGIALNQHILIYAHEYTPSRPDGIPLGTIESVENSPMDLRELFPIQTHINDNYQQLIQAGGYDHNYVINGVAGTLRPAAIAVVFHRPNRFSIAQQLPFCQLRSPFSPDFLPFARFRGRNFMENPILRKLRFWVMMKAQKE